MACGQGKPFMVFSNNEKMDTSGYYEKRPKMYKDGGYVYIDKNDDDTKMTHKEMKVFAEKEDKDGKKD